MGTKEEEPIPGFSKAPAVQPLNIKDSFESNRTIEFPINYQIHSIPLII